MIWLLLVSLAWAFSFGLIKGNLTGVDSNFVAFARMALSLLSFCLLPASRKPVSSWAGSCSWPEFFNLA
jgi:hypothetical protein